MNQILHLQQTDRSFIMSDAETHEYREYERRIDRLKSRDYTEEELEDWKRWAESWIDTE